VSLKREHRSVACLSWDEQRQDHMCGTKWVVLMRCGQAYRWVLPESSPSAAEVSLSGRGQLSAAGQSLVEWVVPGGASTEPIR
jgi:hypothetical protein